MINKAKIKEELQEALKDLEKKKQNLRIEMIHVEGQIDSVKNELENL